MLAGILVAALGQLRHTGQLDGSRWSPMVHWPFARYVLRGLGNTLKIGLTAAALSLVVGSFLGLGRVSPRRWVSMPCVAVIELFRAIPLLLLVYFFLLGMPSLGVRMPPFWQLTTPIVLHAGAVFAEIVRAGVNSLDRGQFDAAAAIGLRRGQATRLIVLPQVFRTLRPALISQLIRTLKESSLGFVVSFPEMLHNGRILGEFTGNFLQAYAAVGLVYIVINYGLSQVALRLDRPQRRVRAATPGVIRQDDAGSASIVRLTRK